MDKESFTDYVNGINDYLKWHQVPILPREFVGFLKSLTSDDYLGIAIYATKQVEDPKSDRPTTFLNTWRLIKQIDEPLYNRGLKAYSNYRHRIAKLSSNSRRVAHNFLAHFEAAASSKFSDRMFEDAILTLIEMATKLTSTQQVELERIHPGLRAAIRKMRNL
ncbi:hypothetical protein L596_023228 [Steinernema carpocapsae]|uniref:Uncharacterized protein n=1 Tax=Steinernema carpocapsae TaxID=34508 RepID=A0A4U5MD82_STECR|nr:hypothetical protein L596_023228 [Steinernema carpocapsae]